MCLSHFFVRSKKFTEHCHEYGEGIDKNYQAFSRANNTKPTESLASYLFNPMCFFPLGHSDTLSIVLMDDFDPSIHHLTSHLTTTIEDVCLGFCPKLESLGFGNHDSTLCEVHAVLDSQPEPLQKTMHDGTVYSVPIHGLQEKTPLLVFTKYKIDGLGAIGQGLLFQQALFKAMASKIQETVALLGKRVLSDQSVADLMSEEDIDSLKCAFLDLQGPEQIGTLMFSRNYSVVMSLVAALRSLTFGDVFHMDDNLGPLLNRSRPHRLIIGLSRKLRGEQSTDIHLLRDNHLDS